MGQSRRLTLSAAPLRSLPWFAWELLKVPARKAGTLIRNPSTGEMVPGAAKPASMRVKIRALSKLKAATVA